MRRIVPYLSLLLLALWVPATQHCAMEAIGLIMRTCTDDCDAAGKASGDDCGSIENGAFKPSADVLKVSTPDLFTCACHLCLQLSTRETAREIAPLAGASFEQPQDWVSTWCFVRRAAPAPRAPSLLCA